MQAAISAAEANRKFSEVLRRVREGHQYVVTAHGRPVARILPFDSGNAVTASARSALLDRLRAAPVHTIGRWTRDELYDEGQ